MRLWERARTPRHKVCGEFIAPEAAAVLDDLGLLPAFLRMNPPSIRRCELHFRAGAKRWVLPEPAFGFSRYALDEILLEEAAARGARISRGQLHDGRISGGPVVVAHGRRGVAAKGRRLFGFKAHFNGPVDDVVHLFFTSFGYVGVSSIEDGQTNVCGLAPEDTLLRYGFDIDELLRREGALSERVQPLCRNMPWVKTGPLRFGRGHRIGGTDGTYEAGDALGFVDPFTGSGIFNALLTGSLAGRCAARGVAAEEYDRRCATLLRRPFAISAMMRAVWRTGMTHLAQLVPGSWLYRLTRPHLAGLTDV